MAHPMSENAQHANALEHAADQYAQHTGTVNVGGINIDAEQQAKSYRRMAATFRAADNGVTDPTELREVGRRAESVLQDAEHRIAEVRALVQEQIRGEVE